jgi:CDGSH-type Zn-finger protein
MTDSTEAPVVASSTPFAVEVESGKTYWWCACGKSSKQPFCDGSHKGGAFTPSKFEAARDEIVWFCGCKRTAGAPRCDGSHKAL